MFPQTKFVAREVTIISVAEVVKKDKRNRFDFITRKRFHFLDKIICQSEDMYHDIIKNYKLDSKKLAIINNPISDGFDLKNEKNHINELKLITVGSLKKIKGHDRILDVLGKLNIPFHYTLVGSGLKRKIFLVK